MKSFLRNIVTGFAFSIGFMVTAVVIGFVLVLSVNMLETKAISTTNGTMVFGKEASPDDIEVSVVNTLGSYLGTLVIESEITNKSDRVYENINVQAFLLIDDIVINSCGETYFDALEPMGATKIKIDCRYTSADAINLLTIEVVVNEARYGIAL